MFVFFYETTVIIIILFLFKYSFWKLCSSCIFIYCYYVIFYCLEIIKNYSYNNYFQMFCHFLIIMLCLFGF